MLDADGRPGLTQTGRLTTGAAVAPATAMRAKAASVLREDPVMAALLDRHDPCDDREREPFERLCVAIVS